MRLRALSFLALTMTCAFDGVAKDTLCFTRLTQLKDGNDAYIYEVKDRPDELIRVLKGRASREVAEGQVTRSQRLQKILPDNAMEVLGVSEVRMPGEGVKYGARLKRLNGYADMAAYEAMEPAVRARALKDMETIFLGLASKNYVPVDHRFNNLMIDHKTGQTRIIDLTSILMSDLDAERLGNQVEDYAVMSGRFERRKDPAMLVEYSLELSYGCYRETVDTFTGKVAGPPYTPLTFQQFADRVAKLKAQNAANGD